MCTHSLGILDFIGKTPDQVSVYPLDLDLSILSVHQYFLNDVIRVGLLSSTLIYFRHGLVLEVSFNVNLSVHRYTPPTSNGPVWRYALLQLDAGGKNFYL